ncbi:MAG TPA: serine hydrolase [Longimicrobiales bacterium]
MRIQMHSRLSRPSAPTLTRALMLTVVLAAALAAPASGQPGPLQGLDAYVEKAMSDWEIPGLAIAVVKDGETVWARGFGVRDLRSGAPVDENTIFAIGSASKAFTAAAVGMLVQEGLLDWDDPATRYLPALETSDPYVTRELTVRDLLTHRSGLNRGDQVWYATEFGREEILRRVRHQPPTSSFRSQFGYNNNMYLAAGQLIEALTGLTWDRFVERRIFAPLGMERSVTSTIPLERMENVAQPHERIDGKVRPIPWRNIDNIAPAGSINSSVAEMARWVQLHLAGGKWKGQQLLDEDVVREMHSAQTIVPLEPPWSLMAQDAHFMMYGMGWFLHDYRGRKIIEHGGNIDGMHALVALLPEEDVGLVILTNLRNSLTYALMYRVFDAYLGGPETDWSARLLEQYRKQVQEAEARQRAVREARVSGTSPSLPLERYAGTYRHAMYGDVEVALEGGRLVARRGRHFVGDLEHWHYDTFRIDWRDDGMGESFITFELNARGEVAGADLQGLGRVRRLDPR